MHLLGDVQPSQVVLAALLSTCNHAVQGDCYVQSHNNTITGSGSMSAECVAVANATSTANSETTQAEAAMEFNEGMCKLRLDSEPLINIVPKMSVAIASVRIRATRACRPRIAHAFALSRSA
jgi:hypothetical protein